MSAIQTMEVKLTSATPLLMHNGRLANPDDKYVRRMSLLHTDKKRKGADKDAIRAELARVEWEGGLYHSETESGGDDFGAYLPNPWIRKMLIEAARLTRSGKQVERAVTVFGHRIKLEHDGPRDIEHMWESEDHLDQRMVTVGRSKVVRTRPIFRKWTALVKVGFSTEVMNHDDLFRFFEQGGAYIGMGDGRGILGLGRFEVSAF